MEYRGNPLDARRRPHTASRPDTRSWQDAVRRGAILGGVLAGHLVVLMLVLHPSWQRIRQRVRPQDDHVIRLSFDPLPHNVRVSPTRATPPIPATRKPVRAAMAPPATITVTIPPASPASPAPSAAPVTTTPAMADDRQRSYRPGDFQARLQDAQRTMPDHLPGADTPRIGGIQLQARSSIKETVRGIIGGSHCANEQFRLQNSTHQFTPEMIDHMLETIGCGPHLGHTAADDVIEAISRDATSGN